MYFIVQGAAADAVLPNLAELSLFADHEQSIYREFERCVQAERMLFQKFKENQHTIAQQEQEIALRLQQVQGLTERLAFRESLMGWLRLPFGKLKRYILGKPRL